MKKKIFANLQSVHDMRGAVFVRRSPAESSESEFSSIDSDSLPSEEGSTDANSRSASELSSDAESESDYAGPSASPTHKPSGGPSPPYVMPVSRALYAMAMTAQATV